MKIQTVGRKVCLSYKCKTLLAIVNKLLKTKSLLTSPSNVYLKYTFPPIIWIFTEGEGDWIESRSPFRIYILLYPLPTSLQKCSSSYVWQLIPSRLRTIDITGVLLSFSNLDQLLSPMKYFQRKIIILDSHTLIG